MVGHGRNWTTEKTGLTRDLGWKPALPVPGSQHAEARDPQVERVRIRTTHWCIEVGVMQMLVAVAQCDRLALQMADRLRPTGFALAQTQRSPNRWPLSAPKASLRAVLPPRMLGMEKQEAMRPAH
jgi:hypothetical protein